MKTLRKDFSGWGWVYRPGAAVILVALALSLALPQAALAANTWTGTGSLGTPRYHHTATLLPNGKVLVAGGEDSLSHFNSSAEL